MSKNHNDPDYIFSYAYNKHMEIYEVVRNFTILYDNGKTFKVIKPKKLNICVEDTCFLMYTIWNSKEKITNGFQISMSDVAGVEIRFMDGSITFKKFKPCAIFQTNLRKK